jgi:hypothetical protein
MKTITRLLGLVSMVAMFIFLDACKTEKGEIGPIGATGAVGATGATGATGVAGPKGDPGNANVIQITYGSKTHTGSNLIYTLPAAITKDIVEKSIISAYVQTSAGGTALWYNIPGATTAATYTYRLYSETLANGNNMYIGRVNTTTGNDIFTTTRILFIPASTLLNGRKAAVDLSDYEAVKKYYNLPD